MQNKARLELADYEAVSLSVVCQEALAVMTFPAFYHFAKKPVSSSSGLLKSQNAPPPSKKLLSNYRLSYKS